MLSEQVGHDLAHALESIEKARLELVQAPIEEVGEKAFAYMQARDEQSKAFSAAQAEYEAQQPAQPDQAPPVEGSGGASGESQPPAPEEPAPAEEASPGVALVRPPGVVVDPANLDQFGVIARYQAATKGEGEEAQIVEGTEYAFAAGTAVQTAEGQIATAQPSRIIRSAPGGELAIVTNDVFIVAYELAPAGEPAPAPEAPAAPEA